MRHDVVSDGKPLLVPRNGGVSTESQGSCALVPPRAPGVPPDCGRPSHPMSRTLRHRCLPSVVIRRRPAGRDAGGRPCVDLDSVALGGNSVARGFAANIHHKGKGPTRRAREQGGGGCLARAKTSVALARRAATVELHIERSGPPLRPGAVEALRVDRRKRIQGKQTLHKWQAPGLW